MNSALKVRKQWQREFVGDHLQAEMRWRKQYDKKMFKIKKVLFKMEICV